MSWVWIPLFSMTSVTNWMTTDILIFIRIYVFFVEVETNLNGRLRYYNINIHSWFEKPVRSLVFIERKWRTCGLANDPFKFHCCSFVAGLSRWLVVFLGNGGQYSSEVAFVLLTQLPRVRFPFSKNYMLHCLFSGLWQLIGPIWYKAGLCKFIWGIVGDYYYKKIIWCLGCFPLSSKFQESVCKN